MSEGFARAFFPTGTFYSAGTAPAERVNPRAVVVMAEKGIDISAHKPEHLIRDITSTGAPLDYVGFEHTVGRCSAAAWKEHTAGIAYAQNRAILT